MQENPDSEPARMPAAAATAAHRAGRRLRKMDVSTPGEMQNLFHPAVRSPLVSLWLDPAGRLLTVRGK